jgi:hypothetical protein
VGGLRIFVNPCRGGTYFLSVTVVSLFLFFLKKKKEEKEGKRDAPLFI